MWLKFFLFCVLGVRSSLTTPSDLGGVLSGNRMAGVPLGRSLGNGELDVEGLCAEPGTACINCTLAVTCIPLPVGYLKVPLQECTGGQTCNARLGQCSDTPVPECEETSQKYQHTCEQVGIFPDAHDCRKFHLCSPPDGTPFGRPADHRTALCPRHYGYNPQTAQCSIRLHKGQCSQKHVPICLAVGQSGPLTTSANHYYVCLRKKQVLYPQIFLCPHGWYFWDGFCHPDQKLEETTAIYSSISSKASTEARKGKDINISTAATEATKGKEKATTPSSSSKKEDRSSEEEKTTAPSTSWLDSFFSTEKATTYAADAFLADKFDLTNYETTDDEAVPSFNFDNSFEGSNEFW